MLTVMKSQYNECKRGKAACRLEERRMLTVMKSQYNECKRGKAACRLEER